MSIRRKDEERARAIVMNAVCQYDGVIDDPEGPSIEEQIYLDITKAVAAALSVTREEAEKAAYSQGAQDGFERKAGGLTVEQRDNAWKRIEEQDARVLELASDLDRTKDKLAAETARADAAKKCSAKQAAVIEAAKVWKNTVYRPNEHADLEGAVLWDAVVAFDAEER